MKDLAKRVDKLEKQIIEDKREIQILVVYEQDGLYCQESLGKGPIYTPDELDQEVERLEQEGHDVILIKVHYKQSPESARNEE